jgi:hypothetical protein
MKEWFNTDHFLLFKAEDISMQGPQLLSNDAITRSQHQNTANALFCISENLTDSVCSEPQNSVTEIPGLSRISPTANCYQTTSQWMLHFRNWWWKLYREQKWQQRVVMTQQASQPRPCRSVVAILSCSTCFTQFCNRITKTLTFTMDIGMMVSMVERRAQMEIIIRQIAWSWSWRHLGPTQWEIQIYSQKSGADIHDLSAERGCGIAGQFIGGTRCGVHMHSGSWCCTILIDGRKILLPVRRAYRVKNRILAKSISLLIGSPTVFLRAQGRNK